MLEYGGAVAEWQSLLPETSPYDLWEELRWHGEELALLLAGHEPPMSTMDAFPLASPALQVDMEKTAPGAPRLRPPGARTQRRAEVDAHPCGVRLKRRPALVDGLTFCPPSVPDKAPERT